MVRGVETPLFCSSKAWTSVLSLAGGTPPSFGEKQPFVYFFSPSLKSAMPLLQKIKDLGASSWVGVSNVVIRIFLSKVISQILPRFIPVIEKAVELIGEKTEMSLVTLNAVRLRIITASLMLKFYLREAGKSFHRLHLI